MWIGSEPHGRGREADEMADPNWFKQLKWRIRVRRAQAEALQRTITSHPHGLGASLIVSLTSHPARFSTLYLTLRAVMNQTIAPDRVILTLTEGDDRQLPPEVLALRNSGLEIRTIAHDIKSFTKLIPVLQDNPDAFIATCDDDLHYRAVWLEGLVRCVKHHPGRIAAHRAHRVTYDGMGQFCSYEAWEKNIDGAQEGPGVFATGVGGVLYPPGAFDPMIFEADRFMRLCPWGDDLWFYWMARRRGTLVRHVGPKTRIVEWPDTQISSLRALNRGQAHDNRNDRAIAALVAELGIPSHV